MQPVDYSIGILPWVFLGGGLLIGILVVLRSKSKRPKATSDLDLVRTDLEDQRDQHLIQLSGDGTDDLNSEDRKLLQVQTARILQRLDALPARTASSGTNFSSTDSSPTNDDSQRPRGFFARHPALTGALLGGGVVTLVAALILIAMQEAAPKPQMAGTSNLGSQPSGEVGSSAMPGSANQPALPPFLQQQVDEMRATLEVQPEDIETRRQLALTLLSADRAFDAFQQANIILESAPQDPEALYITGFVRYLMGQPQEAITLFERAIAVKPEYSQAWLVKGLIQLQLQERAEAITTWQQGVVAAGGTEARLEYLIDQAKTTKTVAEILAEPPPN